MFAASPVTVLVEDDEEPDELPDDPEEPDELPDEVSVALPAPPELITGATPAPSCGFNESSSTIPAAVAALLTTARRMGSSWGTGDQRAKDSRWMRFGRTPAARSERTASSAIPSGPHR
ncbi:hypothetical protein GCM10009663_47870 [Kitasatospora arboriphila]|uniref:Acyl-CoA carboxylase subunit epsilon n=1 Tax=Kitasatospora arboriphila TaxID=258052 RepID=A0ABN1TS01_9ACTN